MDEKGYFLGVVEVGWDGVGVWRHTGHCAYSQFLRSPNHLSDGRRIWSEVSSVFNAANIKIFTVGPQRLCFFFLFLFFF